MYSLEYSPVNSRPWRSCIIVGELSLPTGMMLGAPGLSADLGTFVAKAVLKGLGKT